MKIAPIYVEIPIQAEMGDVWEKTQNPALHEQWDLRFSSINYMDRKENEVQEFTYKTKVAPGIEIQGWGKSIAEHHSADGTRTSSLHFGTDQAISLIREGKGYWSYKPFEDGLIFLTQYDYSVNFGKMGRLIDRILFRPLFGWATALSFDVLKRWAETGEPPAAQYRRFFTIWMLAFFFSFLWLYHGLVPKLIAMHPEEISMVTNTIPLGVETGRLIVLAAAFMELALGLFWLFYKNKRMLFKIQVVTFPLLAVAAIIGEPDFLTRPFNPLTFNLAIFVLSVAGLMLSRDIPTARSCKRKR